MNDGGSDGARIDAIAKLYGGSVIHLPTNRGIGIARNVGAAFLNTDYLLFLDADDRLQGGSLKVLSDALSYAPSAAFAYGNYMQGDQLVVTASWSADLLDRQNVASYCNLWRREAFWSIGGYRSVEVAEDWDLQRRGAAAGLVGGKVDAVIFEHRVHEDSKWQRDSQRLGGLSGVSAWLRKQ